MSSIRPVPYGLPEHAPAPITTRVDDTALVFEGGGMRGTYTAALVQVLLEAGLFFPWVGGISAGCTNTVNMVSRDLWRTREAFVGLTTDPQGGGEDDRGHAVGHQLVDDLSAEPLGAGDGRAVPHERHSEKHGC